MKVWLMSDLHCELSPGWDLPPPSERPDFDVLVVAGDLMPRMERGVAWLRARITDRPVLYVPGNHEAYGADIDRTVQKARHAAAGTNIVVMQHDVHVIDDVQFIASTLWTDFNLGGNPQAAMAAAAAGMNDYRRIRKDGYRYRLRPQDTLSRHMLSRVFIGSQLSAPFAGKRVVITHHAPYRGALPPEMANDSLSPCYASDLSGFIMQLQPDCWIYGHTHQSRDSKWGRTRIITNAKGYGPSPPSRPFQDNTSFDPKLVIRI
jgi:Icc-related predicted phosphoesterase